MFTLTTTPLKIFYVYARRDQELRNELDRHLAALKRSYHLETWFDRQIIPGTNWEKAIEEQLNQADIILLLISPDFLASDYCYNTEMQKALLRHSEGEVKVIPILLRPVYWKNSLFSTLQMLPEDARPVTHWPTSDDAFYNIVLGVEQVIKELLSSRQTKESSQIGATDSNLLTATFSSGEQFAIIGHSPLEKAIKITLQRHSPLEEAVKITLRLKDLRSPNRLPETWYADPKYSSDCLSVFIIESTEKGQLLFQKYLRYGELIGPSAPTEWILNQEIKSPVINTVDKLRTKTVLLLFQPSNVRTKNVYDRDDLWDWVFEAPENSQGGRQVLIYTQCLKPLIHEFLSELFEPEKVLKVQTNHRPYDETNMPVIFTLPEKITLDLNDETVFQMSTDNLKCSHEYALTAKLSNDVLKKQLLYYAISTEMKNTP